MPCGLGIDFGTSGVRAVIVDEQGQPLAQGRTPGAAIDSPRPGWRQQTPGDWLDGLREAIAALPAALRQRVTDIAADGTSGALLLSDANGRPRTPALLYNDARASRQAERIRSIAPNDSGAHGASASLAKWLWLLDEDPERRHYYPLHQADWITGWLTGRYPVSDHNNALKLGFDPVALSFPDWLDAVGAPRNRTPDILTPGAAIAPLRPDAARMLDLNPTATVHAGTTDSIAAFIATGASTTGQAVTSLGSTLVVKIIADAPLYAPEYGVYSHRLGNRWLVGGASNSGGAALRQFFTDNEIRRLSKQIDPEQDSGLDYYPLPAAGERFPIADPALEPRLEPMLQNHEPTRFLHGLFEGIARIESLAYDTLHRLGAPSPSLVLTAGGGAVNPVWRRIRERLLPCPVVEARHSEAAHGAALLAVEAAPEQPHASL